MDLSLTDKRAAVLAQQARCFLGCWIDVQVHNICTAPMKTTVQARANWNDGELVLLEPSPRMQLGIRRLFRRPASQGHHPGKAGTAGGLWAEHPSSERPLPCNSSAVLPPLPTGVGGRRPEERCHLCAYSHNVVSNTSRKGDR